jgi:hypothetical protein
MTCFPFVTIVLGERVVALLIGMERIYKNEEKINFAV